ncbi:MAG: amidohydrolase family protein [Planctomycetota bacterium]|nr:amidohydrolase family protein [Planctomycetota bacterium]
MRRHISWEIAGGCTTRFVAAGSRARPVDGVLIPGLVNAHSHLDLAGSPAVPSRGSFPEWLRSVGALRASGRNIVDAASQEAQSLAQCGVVAVGDIDGSQGEGTRGRRLAKLGGRSYLEIIGVEREAARQRLASVMRTVDTLGCAGHELGLSPHAPYSVHEDVLPEIVRAGEVRGLPLAMHIAESADETRYLMHGDGPFAGFLESIGQGKPFARPPGIRPIEYVERAGLLASGGAVIHGNDLDDDDIDRLARHQSSVVYCHGTHRHFDRPPHRLLELDGVGVDVAFGTDSAASNQEVDLFSELVRLAADRPDVPPLLILKGATHGGRRALKLPEGPATWAVGSVADGCVLGPCPEDLESMGSDALASWAWSGEASVLFTVHAGVVLEPGGASSE